MINRPRLEKEKKEDKWCVAEGCVYLGQVASGKEEN